MVPWFVRGWEMRSDLKCNKLHFTLVMSPYFTLFIGGVPPPSPFLLSSRPRVRVARVCVIRFVAVVLRCEGLRLCTSGLLTNSRCGLV